MRIEIMRHLHDGAANIGVEGIMARSQYDPEGPCPFVQPLLEIRCNDPDGTCLYIDVNGEIDAFMDPVTKTGTPALTTLCQTIRLIGFTPQYHHPYIGSGGPSHLYRNGVLFSRMEEWEGQDLPDTPPTTYSEY